jgi:C4-type Zn-finger protein
MDTSGLSEEKKKEQEQALQMMQSMMSGMGSFTIETVDLKVNSGLSDDLFDGTKLE